MENLQKLRDFSFVNNQHMFTNFDQSEIYARKPFQKFQSFKTE